MNKKIEAITKKMREERRQKNKELLQILTDLVNKSDGNLRFSQILSGYGFVKYVNPFDKRIKDGTEMQFWENEFYAEPRDVLKRVLENLERIDG